MRIISDLTRDTRPSLESLLKEAIHDVIDVDMSKPNTDGDLVAYENYTFYYRVIFLFMQRAIIYYLDSEIEYWCRKELLKEIILPEVEKVAPVSTPY